MSGRLAEYLADPEHGRTRRTAGVVLIVLAAAGGLWAIAAARAKPPRAATAGAPLQMQLLADGRVAAVACVCPGCGAVVGRQAGVECEEIPCPRCRTAMRTGLLFAGGAAAAPVMPATPAAPAPPLLSPDQRDRLLDQGPPAAASAAPAFAAPAPPAALPPIAPPTAEVRPINFVPQRPGASSVCVCAGCGTRVPNDGHLYCPGLRCPACGRAMMAGVRVGAAPAAAAPAAAAAPDPAPAAKGVLVAAPTPPCARATPAAQTTRPAPTYDGAVADIVQRNCLRCHGGALRNLSTYQNLQSYAKSGLLMMMIQPGGPMSHFLAPAEAQQIIDWVEAGQPR
jgi:hypothetical protein